MGKFILKNKKTKNKIKIIYIVINLLALKIGICVSHFLRVIKFQKKWKISQFYEQPYSCTWQDWLDLFNTTNESVTLYKHTQTVGQMVIVPPGYYHIVKYVSVLSYFPI